MGAIYNKVASQGVSMESGLEGRNNMHAANQLNWPITWSQWSPA